MLPKHAAIIAKISKLTRRRNYRKKYNKINMIKQRKNTAAELQKIHSPLFCPKTRKKEKILLEMQQDNIEAPILHIF